MSIPFKSTAHVQYYCVQYIDTMSIYCSLFHLLNTVLNKSSIRIYTSIYCEGFIIIINNIERVQRLKVCYIVMETNVRENGFLNKKICFKESKIFKSINLVYFQYFLRFFLFIFLLFLIPFLFIFWKNFLKIFSKG